MDISTITTTQMMIENNFYDIHSHIIFDVDDGASCLSDSIKYLIEASNIGIKTIVATPHMKHLNIDKKKKIEANFNVLNKYANKLNINLILASEIMLSSDTLTLIEEKNLFTINNSKYILVEVKRNEKMNTDMLILKLEELLDRGYKVILAHPELYINYRTINKIKKIKESGVLLQMDATSIIFGYSNRKVRKFSKQLLKNGLIDFVASDTHCTKKRNYKVYMKAYKYIKRKYGINYANILFNLNAKYMLND